MKINSLQRFYHTECPPAVFVNYIGIALIWQGMIINPALNERGC